MACWQIVLIYANVISIEIKESTILDRPNISKWEEKTEVKDIGYFYIALLQKENSWCLFYHFNNYNNK